MGYIMNLLNRFIIVSCLFFLGTINLAQADNGCDNCCGSMDGIKYCDSSAGRYVCNNGRYSSCYCTIHAIMDLQKLEGCCLWQGGVLKTTTSGLIQCRNGEISEVCGINYNYDNKF